MEKNVKAKKSVFDSPLLSTKVKSARAKIFPEGVLGYFIGPVLAILSNSVMNNYLNKYFSDVLKLPTWASLFSVLLPVISVAFVVAGNILVGKFMDRSKTRAGKARPLILIAIPLIVLALLFLFLTPSTPTIGENGEVSGSVLTLVCVAIGYNLYYAFAYPFYFTSHSALVTLSTRVNKDRSLLATISNATSLAAMGLTSMILPFFLKFLFVTDEAGVLDATASANAWKIFIVALIIISSLGMLIEYYFTRERITEESFQLHREDDAKVAPKKVIKTSTQLKASVKDKFWWFIIIFFFLYQLGGMLKNCSQLYFCQSWFSNAEGVYNAEIGGQFHGTLSIIGAIPTALGMLIVWPLSNKIGKARLVLYGAILAVAGGAIGFIDPSNYALVVTSFVLKALGGAPAMYISLALLSDVLDHGEAKNGFRSDGLTMTIYGAIMIGMSGLANGIINGVLSATNYDVNTLATNDALRTGLSWIFLGGETICYAIIAIMYIFMTVEKHGDEDRKTILNHQKELCLAEGREWIEPSERLRIQEEEAERKAEEARIVELKNKCAKKGLNFEEEEAKYQAALAQKQRIKEEKKALKEAKKQEKIALRKQDEKEKTEEVETKEETTKDSE